MFILYFSSPDRKFLVFFSGRSSVESGAHSCTKSLHRIEWTMDEKKFTSLKIGDVVSSSVLIFFHVLPRFTGRLKLNCLQTQFLFGGAFNFTFILVKEYALKDSFQIVTKVNRF